MNKKLSVALVVATAVLSGGSLVFARGMGGGLMGRGLAGAKLEETAKVLGVTPADLSTQLKDGKTIKDIAKAKGVSDVQLNDAFHAQMMANQKIQFAQLVTKGKITQAQADAQLLWVNEHYQWLKDHPAPMPGKEFGKHGMMGGYGMRGMRMHAGDKDSSIGKTPKSS